MKKARKLLEMAMELGGEPDVVHRAHKQALARGQHALGSHPAISQQAAERHASETYRHLAQKLRDFGGIMPRNRQEINDATVDMFQTLSSIQQREAEHRPALERIAVETVLKLPEFKSLRQAMASGDVKIEPHLSEAIHITNYAFSDEPQEPVQGEEVPEIKAEFEELVNRRKLMNTLTQGAAVANNYAFTNSFDEIADLDHTLVKDYGKVMAYSELGFFVYDPEIMRQAAQ